mmetsp:Transcript_348/g.640  ORF Transcript_348/g.640 Transcript_348/m.640 type:complete len:520 (+) Transcript_348:107-1666(+)
MDDMIDNFVAITSADRQTASMFMEMSGYDMDTAIQLYFDNGGAGGTDFSPQPVSLPTVASEMRLLFSDEVPESWKIQSLAFDYSPTDSDQSAWAGIGITQPKNGPCGVLVSFQAKVIARLMDAGRLAPGVKPSDEDIVETIVDILLQCRGEERVVNLCSWVDPVNGVGKEINTIPLAVEDGRHAIVAALSSCLNQYMSPGGAILLALSAVLTCTETVVRGYGTELPLVVGAFHTCSCALVNLLLSGRPDDSVSAYSPSGSKRSWGEPCSVGLLSGMEHEQKFLVIDELKIPRHPVYVLHGRDHFTLAFQPSGRVTEGEIAGDFQLVHWNGLPPAGPRVAVLQVSAPCGASAPAPGSASEGVGIEYKPTPNTIDSIVQARSEDKASRPGEWKKWKYEVALSVDDPTNQSPERPSHLPPLPTYSLKEDDVQGKPWRCRACYETRFQTMCFGMNDAGAEVCQHCNVPRNAAGWTLWMDYTDLPANWQAYLDRQHGPQIVTVLRTKWPQCEVRCENSGELPSV